MTTRQNIVSFVKTTLEGVSALVHVDDSQPTVIDIEVVPTPAAFIYSGPERRIVEPNYSVIGYETWRWGLAIEVWAQGTDMEILLGSIHEKMHSGETMGGFARTSYRTGVDMLVVDPANDIKSMLIDYEVIYSHPKGAM